MKLFLLPLAMILALLAACAPRIEITTLTPDELTQARVYGDPQAENLVQALKARVYEDFSKDFNPTMHDVLAKSNFEEMLKTFDDKLGVCADPAFADGIKMNSNLALTYTLACQKDTDVKMQVVFEPDDPHLMAGVFFISPKLQQ